MIMYSAKWITKFYSRGNVSVFLFSQYFLFYLQNPLHYNIDLRNFPSNHFIRFVDRIKDKFEQYPDKMFPLKQKCLNAMYKMIAWVYIDSRNLTCLGNEETKTRYLKHHLGIRIAMLPRDSDLAWMPIMNPKETSKVLRRYN